jgi:hypothetical protein
MFVKLLWPWKVTLQTMTIDRYMQVMKCSLRTLTCLLRPSLGVAVGLEACKPAGAIPGFKKVNTEAKPMLHLAKHPGIDNFLNRAPGLSLIEDLICLQHIHKQNNQTKVKASDLEFLWSQPCSEVKCAHLNFCDSIKPLD